LSDGRLQEQRPQENEKDCIVRYLLFAILLSVFVSLNGLAQDPLFESQFIFDPAGESHGHVHASCLVECPNGDLRAVWYENGTALPAPYFSEQQDKSADVRVGGAYKPAKAAAWNTPFVMQDSFGIPDDNPSMVVDGKKRLWLVHATLIGVPGWTWGSALTQYRVSSDYERPGVPTWDRMDILIPQVEGLAEIAEKTVERMTAAGLWPEDEAAEIREELAKLKANPLAARLGWMPRAHPFVRSDGAVILPLSNENFSVPAMAITTDGGATWTFSKPVPEAGLIQPTLVEFPDKTLVAFFRNGTKRIRRSESKDGGLTWSAVTATTLPHVGSGQEAVLLESGSLVMIYNDKEKKPRDRLAVSLSEDGGKTWPWKRHLEDTPGGRFDYPSLIQAQDGSLHATYSYNLKTIKYARFNEAWLRQDDK
jgi:predicted neuraminidase